MARSMPPAEAAPSRVESERADHRDGLIVEGPFTSQDVPYCDNSAIPCSSPF